MASNDRLLHTLRNTTMRTMITLLIGLTLPMLCSGDASGRGFGGFRGGFGGFRGGFGGYRYGGFGGGGYHFGGYDRSFNYGGYRSYGGYSGWNRGFGSSSFDRSW